MFNNPYLLFVFCVILVHQDEKPSSFFLGRYLGILGVAADGPPKPIQASDWYANWHCLSSFSFGSCPSSTPQ